MAKRRHEAEQTTSSKTTIAVMAVGALAVAALVVWALTRTVQPAPSVTATATAPVGIEQPANTPTDTAPFGTTAGNVPPTTAGTPPATQPPVADENASVPRITVADLRPKVDAKQVTVIDVRDKTSFMGGHIPGSLNVPVAQMESQITFLPKDKPIVTVCT